MATEFYNMYNYDSNQVKESIQNEPHTVPMTYPYIVYLRYIPKKGTVVVDGYVEVDGSPQEGEYRVYYSENRGKVEFNIADSGRNVLVNYDAIGSVIWAEDRPLDGIFGINRITNAIKKLETGETPIEGSLLPDNGSRNLGSSSNRWNTIYGSNLNLTGNISISGTVDGRDISQDGSALDSHLNNSNNPHNVTKVQIGLGNVENKSSATIRSEITQQNVTNALGYIPENQAKKGVADGYASLDANGKVPLSQLPDFTSQQTYVVLDSTEREALDGLVQGDRAFETSTGDSYIWDGSQWLIMADADWENVNLDWANIINKPTSSVANIDDAVLKKHSHSNMSALESITQTKITNWDSHLLNTNNPHSVNKVQIGLGNVDNVKQASKAEFDAHVANVSNPHNVTKAQIGLGNVENKSSATIRSEITTDNVTGALGFLPENVAKKGQANGYPSLDGSGRIPLSQLPSSVFTTSGGAILGDVNVGGDFEVTGLVRAIGGLVIETRTDDPASPEVGRIWMRVDLA